MPTIMALYVLMRHWPTDSNLFYDLNILKLAKHVFLLIKEKYINI